MSTKREQERTLDELWEVIQGQQQLIDELRTKQRRRNRLRLIPVALTLLLAGAMVVSPASAAGNKPGTSGVEPAASGGICTPAQLTGDATNTCPGTTDFNASSGSFSGSWNFTDDTADATTIHATCPNGTACWAVEGDGTGYGVLGNASASPGTGVYGKGDTGVEGQGVGHSGVVGLASGASYAGAGPIVGVYGGGSSQNTASPLAHIGVYGESDISTGVLGSSPGGIGVQGSGATAVSGTSSVSNGTGVYGQVTSGYAVRGVGSSGNGVRGESTSGYGMVGTSVSAVGGYLRGKAIQLHLQPTAATPPTAAQRGDLMADTAGHLWFCTTTGTGSAAPATWVKIV